MEILIKVSDPRDGYVYGYERLAPVTLGGKTVIVWQHKLSPSPNWHDGVFQNTSDGHLMPRIREQVDTLAEAVNPGDKEPK